MVFVSKKVIADLELIETKTLSGASTTFSSLPTDCNVYLLVYEADCDTADNDVAFIVNAHADYSYWAIDNVTLGFKTTQSNVRMGYNHSAGMILIERQSYQNVVHFALAVGIYGVGANQVEAINGGVAAGETDNVTSITLKPSASGNLTGRASLYKLKI